MHIEKKFKMSSIKKNMLVKGKNFVNSLDLNKKLGIVIGFSKTNNKMESLLIKLSEFNNNKSV